MQLRPHGIHSKLGQDEGHRNVSTPPQPSDPPSPSHCGLKGEDMTEFTKQGSAVSDSEIDAFEAKIGLPIPAAYRAFLKVNNGGQPEFPYFEFSKHHDEIGDFEVFYALGGSVIQPSLEEAFENEKAYLPTGHFPIGRSGGNDLFTVSTDHQNAGCVWCRDYEIYSGNADHRASYFLVNQDFQEFLGSLCEWKWDD